ncbi:hypothetical protein BKA61DRAFT_653377 [Leptodontidium sp. MPI-SDFR-AT-0119]|nr:hypothetical protein BKA61DRAFT_653377 [Leptodontidium sp. MPI-SDFR-AT-0119]
MYTRAWSIQAKEVCHGEWGCSYSSINLNDCVGNSDRDLIAGSAGYDDSCTGCSVSSVGRMGCTCPNVDVDEDFSILDLNTFIRNENGGPYVLEHSESREGLINV